MEGSLFSSEILLQAGPVPIGEDVVTTWGIMLVLAGLACLVRLRLATRPARLQVALEAIVATVDREIREITRQEAAPLLPLIATLFVFIATANLCGVLPGVHAPTAKIETPAALAADRVRRRSRLRHSRFGGGRLPAWLSEADAAAAAAQRALRTYAKSFP